MDSTNGKPALSDFLGLKRAERKERPAERPDRRKFRPAVSGLEDRKLQTSSATLSTVASFHASGPPKPGKVTKLKLARKGSSLVVTWKAPKSVFRHAVYVVTTDGRKLVLIVSAGVSKATFAGITKKVGATVRVSGLTVAGGKGPTVTARLR